MPSAKTRIVALTPEFVVEPAAKRLPRAPKDVAPKPTMDQQAYYAALASLAEEVIAEDPLVSALDSDDVDVLQVARIGIAKEAARLLWIRRQMMAAGLDHQRVSSRRIKALADVGKLTVEMHSTAAGEVPADVIATLKVLFLQSVEEAAEVLPEKAARRLLSRLRELLGSATD